MYMYSRIFTHTEDDFPLRASAANSCRRRGGPETPPAHTARILHSPYDRTSQSPLGHACKSRRMLHRQSLVELQKYVFVMSRRFLY